MKKITAFLIFVLSFHVFGQKISSSKWTDLFSYNNIVAIREDNGRLITATENGIFFYTPASGEITKLSKANGLHEVKISAFDYNPETKIGLVGYKNGALDVITPDGITYVVDIPIATGYNGEKKINHISITGNFAVISVGYGVSIFRLDKKEFGDSAFFINSGIYQEVKEAVIKDNAVYAATSTGLKSHSMPDPTNVTFPIYNTWTTIASGDIKQVATGGVIAYAHNNKVYYSAGGPFSVLSQTFSSIQDVVVNSQNLIVANGNSLSAFDFSGNSIKSLDATEKVNTGIFTDSKLYAGTKLSGIINESGEHLKPDGPYNNTSYKIDIQGDKLLVSSGARESYNNAIYNNLGYYHFDGAKWIYPELFKNSNVTYNVLDAVINPAKLSEIFFTNYSTQDGSKGIYKMNDDQFVKIYKSTGGSYNRVVGCTFDEDNQLFVSVWSGGDTSGKGGFYYYNSSIDDFNLVSVTTLGVPQKPFSHDGILYIFSAFFNTTGGMLIYDYNKTLSSLGDDRFKLIRQGNNLPADGVVSAALDQNDDLWIGTRIGLRILQNPSSAIDEANPQTEPIIIEENGVGEELFRDGQILQIEVDSGNQKWVSVDDGGVFYLSPNGEQTLTFFNRANSPLPTNNVTDIKVDKKTGKVYFVTLDGVVVYQGDVLTVTKDFGDVLVYPNPVVYAQYKGNVSIRGLAAKTNIRITDAAGNLVHQAVARGGSYEWNLANHRGVRVASGIYFVLMTNEDGTDTATAKIAVVN
ncbi:T9SS type A sorting domain-containing protein [Chryseobacterium sp. SNU WT5]|uniref:type IX secretion system anionic LPS delivery protein PorZ n=1 Tax=Chryseobacterium sp. SNU WT5 TaxID=2594269 RepID=UPI00117FC12C|nr:T9SS type A sorting domain-containing protein [Chryseobacterium sp. SNU WT5]QDP86016.1 T9SS type A sorting domain-containing protein [Chryseobacterium sp. SNU WT5]